jgi:WD40 repeat protein
MWPEGLVIRTGHKSELYVITNYTEPKISKLPDLMLTIPPVSMCIIGHGNTVEVLVATSNGSILVIDSKSVQDQLITTGPFTSMILSPDQQLIACFNDDGTLHILNIELNKHISKFQTGSKIPPLQLNWCGNDGIILTWSGMILLVNIYGDFIKYTYEYNIKLITEFDGCRIVSNVSCEWLHRVPESTEAIFKIGSNSYAAKLYDAQEAFENKVNDIFIIKYIIFFYLKYYEIE